MLNLRLILIPVLTLCTLSAHADSVFNFEATPVNSGLPLTLTNSGLTATFAGQGVILDSQGYTANLSGHILAEYANSSQTLAPLQITFSQNLSSLNFSFATQQSDGLHVSLFENGIALGAFNFDTAVPPGYSYPEGFASLSGTFNALSITTNAGSNFAVDNFSAIASTPEPSSLMLLGTGILGLAAPLRRRHAVGR